jgi:hypothetical protein
MWEKQNTKKNESRRNERQQTKEKILTDNIKKASMRNRNI